MNENVSLEKVSWLHTDQTEQTAKCTPNKRQYTIQYIAGCYMLIHQQMAEQLLLHGSINEGELLKLSLERARVDVGVALLANSGM